jgi:hypothetical protein
MGLNPVGYWPLNETTPPPQPLSLTATNLGSLGASGNGSYGVWYQPSGNTWYLTNNIVETTGATSDGDLALNCQYAPGQYVILPRNTNGVANSAITINAPFSIETWVRVGTVASRLGDIVSEGEVQLNAGGPNTNNPFYGGTGGTSWAGFELGQYANFFFFSCNNTNAYNTKSSELDGPKNLSVGEWVHLVVTFDGAVETMFENGAQVGQKTVAPNAAGLTYVPDPTSPLMIGSGGEPSVTYGVSFAGTLDEVAIYPSVLPQSSILAHYQTAGGTNATYGGNYASAVLADNPLIYFRMDDSAQMPVSAGYPSASFPVATNYGAIGSDGNGVYQPGTTPGVAGPAYGGFGTDSRAVAINGWLGGVDVGNSNIPVSLNPTGAAPLTVVTWFQTGPADAPGRFQEMVGHSDSSYRLSLGQVAGENHFNPGPGPELQFTTSADVATNGFAFNDGQWHMAAGVSDGTNEYLYLDGVVAKTNGNAAGINIVGSSRDLLLGGDPQYTYASATGGNTIRNFDGQIAYVAFWTNALTSGQIQSLFAAAEVPPYIWRQPVRSETVNSGQPLSIPVGLRGSGTLNYQWYENGAPVAGQTAGSLTFAPVTVANAGAYYLVGSNPYGAVTSGVVNVTVYGSPTILQQTPTQLDIFAGASPTLRVSAVGAEPISYQWSENGTPIAGATNSSFTVVDVQSSGTYACSLNNSVGQLAINPILLTVQNAPVAPYPVAVLSGGPAAYFRLDEANGPTAYDYVGGNNATYNNVTLGVPGYSSDNAVPSDPSETAAEFGDVPPDNDYAGNVPGFLNFSTPGGSNAEFTVEAWVNEYLYLNSGNGVVSLGAGNGGEQFVLDTGNGTSGELRFFVRNAAGVNYNANSTNLLVNDGLWHHVAGVCDEAGGHLYVYLDGVQAGSANIPTNSGVLNSTAPLTIGARQSGNSTNYDFQFIGKIDDVAVYNRALSASEVQAHYLASGIAPFDVQVQPLNFTTNQDSTVTFAVSGQGTAPLTYQWSDPNANPIPGQTNSTLIITNVQQAQSGNYTVTVSNPYGSATVNATLNVVLGPPQIIADIQPTAVMVFAGDPVDLAIQVSGSQPLSYQWYQDGSVVRGATNGSYSSGPTVSSVATVVGAAVSTLAPATFNSHLKITFAGYNRDETLSDFPVLVRLSADLPGFSYSEFASASGGDLRFADANGSRELPYEVDQWNDSNGVSSVWVQVPQLSSTNDFIWAYWGNPADITPPAYTTNGAVWQPADFLSLPNYDLVWHLKEPGFPYVDSTLDYPATNGLPPTAIDGIVGNGELFNGVTNYLDAGPVTNLDDAFTVSTWLNIATNAGNIQTIWANQKGGYGSPGFALFVDYYLTTNHALLLDTGDGTNGSEQSTAAGAVTFGQWHLITAAVDRTNRTVALYVDGVSAPVVSGNPLVADFVNNADLNLGQLTNNVDYFDGIIDEARIHSGIESSNWVWASYMTVASNSVWSAYSSITNSTAPSMPLTIQALDNQVILMWSPGTLQSASSVNGPYSDIPGATPPYTNIISTAQQFYRVRIQ